MQKNDSAADDVMSEPCSREDFSSPQLSWEDAEERWRLLRAFSNIRNPALRNIILDMVSALSWQDSQVRPALAPNVEFRSLVDRNIVADGPAAPAGPSLERIALADGFSTGAPEASPTNVTGTAAPPRLWRSAERDSHFDLLMRGALIPCIRPGMMPTLISVSR
jgi:hypothetical protein